VSRSDAAWCRLLIGAFDDCFRSSEATVLRGGYDEPEYLPGTPLNELRFRADFPASALHESAHYLMAGPERRRLRDFGYWYEPDGRDPATQARFEQCEARNQALESLLCEAAGLPFLPSFDNLAVGGAADPAAFARRIAIERATRLANPPSPRIQRFLSALAALPRA
jgi:hypothetical protein